MWELGGEHKGFGDPGFSLANLMLTPFSRKTQAFTCLLALPSPPPLSPDLRTQCSGGWAGTAGKSSSAPGPVPEAQLAPFTVGC